MQESAGKLPSFQAISQMVSGGSPIPLPLRNVCIHGAAFVRSGIEIDELPKNIGDLTALNAAGEFQVSIDKPP